MLNRVFLLGLILMLFSCNDLKPNGYLAGKTSIIGNGEHPGKKLMETNCYVCHSTTANHDNRLAPPMIAVKKHYITNTTTKVEFKKAIQDWIKNPNETDAKMFGAVKRFGVMPKQAFPKETIDQISDYMFDNNIEQPEWFDEHFNGMKKKKN